MHRAVAAVVPDRRISVDVSSSYLVEEAILDEAQSIQADVIVLGRSRKAAWRRFLGRLVGNGPAIAPFLRAHTDAEIVVVG
jgi:nucleotide-binding universal stress UspA family protein